LLVDINSFQETNSGLLVPVRYVTQVVEGVEYVEPWWDYNDAGIPEDFGFDETVLDHPGFELGEYYSLSPSDFAATAIRIPIKGQVTQFSFEGRPYLPRIYDSPAKRKLLMAGRQVEKSTTLGNLCLGSMCITPAFRALYVAPTAEQSRNFSKDRIQEPIDVSPTLQAYTNSKLTNAMAEKKFVNHSVIRLRYAYLTADRVRGIMADLVLVDELQDILTDNLPVIEECASHSAFKEFVYSGTPKSVDNTIEHYWSNYSTQNEWVVPCFHHGTPKNPSSWHWNILGENNIGKDGLICDVCGRPIDPYCPEARWAQLNPQTEENRHRVIYEGYRLPQIMVPWILNNEWDDIHRKQQRYGRAQFYNEVLGRSYDSGQRPISKVQLQACCREEIHLGDLEHYFQFAQNTPIWAGLDWGCHDEETRILTQDGWKYFRDLTDGDLVAQWDPISREMSLVRPIARTVRNWDQPLHHYRAKGLDMALTHTHRMRVGRRQGKSWVTERSEKTSKRGGNIKFVGHLRWVGEERAHFLLPGLPTSPGYSGCTGRTLRMDDWLEFLGYMLAEGGVCLKRNRVGDLVPYHLRMSQRESVSPENAKKIKNCMDRLRIPYSEFPNPETGDLNWSINGKQYWHWFSRNVGLTGDVKRIPREFFDLSRRQLQILFDAMSLGDGYEDPREGNNNGAYYSTSKGLCEDFQELCIRLGKRCVVRLHKPEEGNRKARWRALWSHGRDFQLNTPKKHVEQVPYVGKVYCCKVPSGYIVTERNGCVAYQGNTGENSFTVMTLGGYLGTGNFTIFWVHRFTGRELEPEYQLDTIRNIIARFNVVQVGCDYGGGFDRNKALIRSFGPGRVLKYQYNNQQRKGKIYYEDLMGRFMVHRSEVMSDIFAALRNRQIDLPHWEDFHDPYGADILNIFAEFNARTRMIQYHRSPGTTDDTFHSILLCFLVSMIRHPRPDIITPMEEREDGFTDNDDPPYADGY